MTILEVQQYVCDKLAASDWFRARGIVPLAEDKGDVDNEAERALAEVGLSVVVMTPEVDYAGDAADGTPYGQISRLEVAAAETPANRIEAGHPSALDAAYAAARVLHAPGKGISFSSLAQATDGGATVVTRALFTTTIILGGN